MGEVIDFEAKRIEAMTKLADDGRQFHCAIFNYFLIFRLASANPSSIYFVTSFP